MIGRTYPYGWPGILGRTKTGDPAKILAYLGGYTKVNPEAFRRVMALADYAADHGHTLGPGGGWRSAKYQLAKATEYHYRDDDPNYARACAARLAIGRNLCQCHYDGHRWVQKDGKYLRAIHKAMPPSWHNGVPTPADRATVHTADDLDRFACVAFDLTGSGASLDRAGMSFIGLHAHKFGLRWAGKNDPPHVQAWEVERTHRPTEDVPLIPTAGMPLKVWQCPAGYNDPLGTNVPQPTTENDDMARIVQVVDAAGKPADPAQFFQTGMTLEFATDASRIALAVADGVARKAPNGKPYPIQRAALGSYRLVGNLYPGCALAVSEFLA